MPVRLSIVAAAFALLAIPTLATAHGGNNDPNVVHACIGNVSKIVTGWINDSNCAANTMYMKTNESTKASMK